MKRPLRNGLADAGIVDEADGEQRGPAAAPHPSKRWRLFTLGGGATLVRDWPGPDATRMARGQVKATEVRRAQAPAP